MLDQSESPINTVYYIPNLSDDDKLFLFDNGYVPCPFCLKVMINYKRANYCPGVILLDKSPVEKHQCGHPLHRGLSKPSGKSYRPLESIHW